MAIAELYRTVMGQIVTENWGRKQAWRRAEFDQHYEPQNITVVLVGNKPVGFCQVEDKGRELFIRMLALLPGYQGRGIGKRLLNAVIASAEAQSRGVSLQVFKTNIRARRFYAHNGFRVTGTTSGGVTMTYSPGKQEPVNEG